jgi:hypothetical protein
MAPISNQPQPELSPVSPPSGPPSLWLYAALLLIAIGLISAAFEMQAKPDWPSLLLNLAAGLVGSVVILVVVDRRLRTREIAAIRGLPVRTTQRVSSLLFPTSRLRLRYARRLLTELEPLVAARIELEQFPMLEEKVREGFVLVSNAGMGKTVWTQIVAANLIRRFMTGQSTGRIPIVFPLARWLQDSPLDDALYEAFNRYTLCRRWLFDRLLRVGNVVIILDGYDELWNRRLPLDAELKRLRQLFPKIAWTITSRADKPTPAEFGERMTLSAPTDEELAQIQTRAGK